MANLKTQTRNWFFIFILLFVLPSFANISSAEEDYVPDELIVGYKGNVDSESPGFGGIFGWRPVKKRFSEMRAVVIKLGAGESVEDVQRSLENNPDVEYVEKNYVVRANLVPNDTYFHLQDYLYVIDAPQAWDKETGSSDTVIAVLDTGVRGSHVDISGKVLPGCNVLGDFTENNCSSNTNDDHNHGTAVAGTAALKTNNSTGAAGVCWNCYILPVKVLNSGGTGTLADTVEGILFARNYALSNPSKKVIINMSLGRECNTKGVTMAEQDAIDLAWASGVLIIASAGNDGNSLLQCPASADHVIAVSATTDSDQRASFSSYGSFVDLAAPGVRIVSAYGTSSYAYWSGTSFSAPIVSGVAGLVWSVDPSLTNTEVDQVLRDTAENIGSSFYFGDGRVNADFAVVLAGANNPAPPTPTPAPTPAPTPTPPPTPGPTPAPTPPPPGTNPVLMALVPGSTGSNSISVTGAPQGSRVTFYYALRSGSAVISGGACSGRVLNIGQLSVLGTATTDGSGTATANVSISRRLNRRTLYIQAAVESSSTCYISNRLIQTIGSGGSSPAPPDDSAPRRPRWGSR